MSIRIKEDQKLQRRLESARQTAAYQLEAAIHTFSDELWEAMEARGLSQADLARKAGVSRQFLTKVFRGDNNFTLETMVKLAFAVGHKVNVHLSPAEVECEWQHFFKTKPSISAADWKTENAFASASAAGYEDLALAA